MEFSWYDYLIFVIVLGFSTAIGIYYGCFGSRQETVNKYLLGGRKMTPLPVALSVAVGHFSAIMILGFTADVYKFGAYYIFACLSMALLTLMTIYFYYSVFFNLKITSLYEYLDKRFDYKTRLMGSFLYIISDILVLPVIAYGPSLALSAATGIHVYWISVVTCSVCIFYTAIGGLKTVVWTDLYQLALILISLTSVLVIGTLSSGGFLVIWNRASKGGRFDIFDFDLNPTKKDSFWAYAIGFTFFWTQHVSLAQGAVQKYLSLPTFKDCVRAVIYFMVTMNLVIFFCVFIGLAIYEKYADCDPVISKKIRKHDEIVPYYVMDIAAHFPGIPGLFIMALFCASLSSISSSLNAMSGVIYKDFLSRFLSRDTKERKAVTILKVIVVVIGVILICLTFIIEHMGDLLALGVSLSAVAGGPTMGMFTLGVLFPRANATGAFYGAICGLICSSFVIFPLKLNMFGTINAPSKVLSTNGCTGLNETLLNVTTNQIHVLGNESTEVPFLFRISQFYHCFMGTLVTVLVGLLISYTTKTPLVDKSLISPISHRLLPKEPREEGESLPLQNK